MFHLRRLVLLILVAASTDIAASLMADIVGANGWTWPGIAEVAFFAISFTGLAIAFWTAVVGFVIRLIGGDPNGLMAGVDASRPLLGRTVLVMPIYNEDTARVAAGLEATLGSLEAESEHGAFEVFVLSDTRRPEIAECERTTFAALRDRHAGRVAVHYRRRERNLGRKAGNIAEFVRNWGARHDYMVVLDADSVMTGPSIVALARMMEQNPSAGIIQTVPMAVNRDTPFARILQFAGRLYGPMVASGFAFWTGGDGNYYGHNAIIRIAAFAEHCGLPVIPGRAPLAGEILSHDFVEAALMRSGGFKVWIVPALAGSYEEMPANIVDYAARDRRWSQGNLQHLRLLFFPGVPLVSRLHLVMGIMAYLASPAWLLLLLLATGDFIRRAMVEPVYFKPGFNLFPDWPIVRSSEIDVLLGITLAALFLPKVLGIALTLLSRRQRRGFGGALGLVVSALGEILFSAVFAPIMMIFQSIFVVSALAGRTVGWEAQPRDDRGLSLREALTRHGPQLCLGLLWGGVVAWLAPTFFWPLFPVFLGLVAAVPLAIWSSRAGAGQWLKRHGLFVIPEETRTPATLRRMTRAIRNPAATTGEASAALAPAHARLAMSEPPWPRPFGTRAGKTLIPSHT